MSATKRRRRLVKLPITGVALLVSMLEPGCGRTPLLTPSTRADGGAAEGVDELPPLTVPDAGAAGGAKSVLPSTRDWQAPELIEDFPAYAYGAHVVMDAQANVTAIWRQYGGSELREGVGASRFDRKTKTWGQARHLDDGTFSTATPTMAMDAAGNVLVVWERTFDVESPRNVIGTRFDIEVGTWQAPGPIGETTSAGMLDPIIGLGDDGDGVVVWLESELRHSLHAARYVGGAWQPAARLLEQKSGSPGYPQLGVDGSGNATILWAEVDGPSQGLFLRQMDARSGIWGETATLCTSLCSPAQLAVANSGQTAVVWAQPNAAAAQLHVAFASAPIGQWREEVLPGAGSGSPISASIAVAEPVALLLWRRGEAQDEVVASRRSLDGLWSPPVLLGRNAAPHTRPQIAVDASGAAIATWEQWLDAKSRVVAVHYDPTSDAWSEVVLLDDGSGVSLNPEIAVNAAGVGVVIWEQQEPTGESHMWASRWQ